MLSSLPGALAVVTRVAEGLQIRKVEGCAAPIDRDDMIDHLRWGMATVFYALLAQGLLRELHGPQLAPRGRLVELRVGMNASFVRTMLRQPRAADGFLKRRHIQKMMSGFSGKSWSSVSKPTMRTILASG